MWLDGLLIFIHIDIESSNKNGLLWSQDMVYSDLVRDIR